MKKHILIAALAALCLTACNYRGNGQAGTPTSETPQVGVENGKITINPDPIRFKVEQKNVKITWQLPKGSQYRFPANGISFKNDDKNQFPASRVFINCMVEDGGAAYSCVNLHPGPGEYKYDITVQGGDKTPPTLDPIAVND